MRADRRVQAIEDVTLARPMASPIDPSLLAVARAAWPQVAVDDATFAAFVADVAPGTPPGELDLPTLYIACACLRDDAGALAAFERAYLSKIPEFLSRITNDPASIDEICQLLRIKLFVGDGTTPPRITAYVRGSFMAWLRVVVCRLAIDYMRARDRPMLGLDEQMLEPRALASDPAMSLIKEQYRAQVSAMFGAALAALSPGDRTMLRLCFLDDLGLAEIGRIFHVSKSAVSRRLARCRASLLADVKRRLRAELRLNTAEIDSIMRLLASQLEISLRRLLA